LLVIRLARTGRNKYATYRIVAADSKRAATGKFVSVLGHYNPHTKQLVINKEEITKRMSQGAQPSNTVAKLLQREKVELPAWVQIKTKAPKAKEAAEEEVKPKAEASPESSENAESEAPALENAGERVAEINEDAAAEAESDVTPIDHTDTAADEQTALEKAEEQNSL
jgi:small subunit ribosomal protein S16